MIRLLSHVTLLALFGVAQLSSAQDLRATGRKLAEDYRAAIVTIRIVTTIGSGNNEVKMESSGTVINPDGLTLVSLPDIDPASLIRRMYGGRGDMENFNSRVKDIKLVMEDKKEIPATVVLRDADLNMAFLRPIEKPKEPMKAIDLTQSTQPELLDPILVLSRLGAVADRQIHLQSAEVGAVVNKPRRFYVPSPESDALAVPAFTAEGKVIGIVLMRTAAGGMDGMGGVMGMGQSPVVPVILTAADVLEVAQQAPQEGEKLDEAPAGVGPLKGDEGTEAEPANAEESAPEE